MISRQEILGAWALVSYELRAIDGTLIEYPFGDDAQGFLIYTDDGYMSAQLMRRDRPLYDHPSGAGGTTEQSAAAARGYLAYSGPFAVDEDNGTVRHHVFPCTRTGLAETRSVTQTCGTVVWFWSQTSSTKWDPGPRHPYLAASRVNGKLLPSRCREGTLAPGPQPLAEAPGRDAGGWPPPESNSACKDPRIASR